MPLPQPTFDSRTYREILNEAIARIPAHNPEWTNFNDADPGITLLQLFAFMTENIIYRANLIPERNRQKFLRLLRLPMRSASAARGLVTLANPRGALTVFTLDKNLEVSAGNVPFRTENGMDVLPIETRLYYKKPLSEEQRTQVEDLYRQLYAAYDLADTALDFYETTVFEPAASGVTLRHLDLSKETKDGALWVALLARATDKDSLEDVKDQIGGKILSLGILPALNEKGAVLYPLGPAAREDQPSLTFEVPNAEDERIRYEPLVPAMDHDPLVQPGVVKLTLPSASKLKVWEEGPLTAGVGNRPPSLEETDDAQRLISWIRIRASQVDTRVEASSRQLSINLSWVGINATSVIQRAHVPAEQLAKGTGEPDQTATLANTPVIDNTLELTVNGEIWTQIDDLSAAPPEVPVHSPRLASNDAADASVNASCKVYTLDLESGEIHFGNGARGTRPPKGAVVQASYDYGGGSQGMVAINTINKASALPSGVKATNPVPTWGGSQAETVDEAERRIPRIFRHGDRMVSEQDYIDIAKRTPGVDLGRVEVLSLFHPKLPKQTSDGVVTLMVIPQFDTQYPNAPRPDRLFLEAVCAYLSPRRILTTELHIRGPEYQPIWISVGIDTVPGYDPGPVRERAKAEIERFISPLTGGFESQGWPLGKVVDALEITAAVTRVAGVAKVNRLRLGESTDAEVSEVIMEGLELPQLMKVVVMEGDAPTLEEIRGDTQQSSQEGEVLDTDVVPVPIVPSQC